MAYSRVIFSFTIRRRISCGAKRHNKGMIRILDDMFQYTRRSALGFGTIYPWKQVVVLTSCDKTSVLNFGETEPTVSLSSITAIMTVGPRAKIHTTTRKYTGFRLPVRWRVSTENCRHTHTCTTALGALPIY